MTLFDCLPALREGKTIKRRFGDGSVYHVKNQRGYLIIRYGRIWDSFEPSLDTLEATNWEVEE